MPLNQAMQTKMKFGKFRDRPLSEVLEKEPTYLDWLIDKARLHWKSEDAIKSRDLREAIVVVYEAHEDEIAEAVERDRAERG